MTFPALFALFCLNELPPHTNIYGYSRSELSDTEFHKRISENFKQWKEKQNDFLKLCHYFQGHYDNVDDFRKLHSELEKKEDEHCTRIFYMAIPPSSFAPAAKCIKEGAYNKRGSTRLIIEKPYGKDLDSAKELTMQLSTLWTENQIYRIDHFLGKEMVQNILALRFSNTVLPASWNRNYIAAVMIDFRENFGIEGRGGYFDEYGMIRDVLENHLLQVMSLLGMECPSSMKPDDISAQKVKFMKEILPVSIHETVLGQYEGYRNDKSVTNKQSVTETFACMVLHVNNDRWHGVPFIIRCGKGLNAKYSKAIIQFHESRHPLYPGVARNELVITISPEECVKVNINNKYPGMENKLVQTEIDMRYKDKFTERVPSGYERLIYDILQADHSVFVREDEVNEAWKIFTPLLHDMERNKVEPIVYPFGSTGPKEADDLVAKSGFLHDLPKFWKHS